MDNKTYRPIVKEEKKWASVDNHWVCSQQKLKGELSFCCRQMLQKEDRKENIAMRLGDVSGIGVLEKAGE